MHRSPCAKKVSFIRDTGRYIKERIDPETLDQAYGFYCWGQKQEADVKAKIAEKEKLLVTGNPRIDLLRPEFKKIWSNESAQICRTMSPFILINTNFSRYNRLPGTSDVIQLLKERGTLDRVAGPEYYLGLVQHLSKIMSAFLDVIPKIAERFSKHMIVVRPHPAENLDPYRSLATRHSNVRVINAGHVVPWLISAEAIVHNSCTTGVEGWILDRPVISYMPVENPSYDSQLPNDLSFKCFEPNELLNKIENVITQGLGAKRDSHTLKLAKYYISGLTGPMAADLLLDHLPKVDVDCSLMYVVKDRVLASCKSTLRKIPGLRLSSGLIELGKQKFPGLEEKEVNDFLHIMSQCRPELNNIQAVKMGRFKNVFFLSRI